MDVVQERYIELSCICLQRPLKPHEVKEFQESLQYIVNKAWKVAMLDNFATMAYMTEDWDWLHEVCREIDQLNERE